MRDGEGAMQPGDAGASVPAIPPVDINTRAANRQTVELVLDGAVQFGVVRILAHGVASLTASVLDFGGERMSEAELVSLISAQKALQFVVLACCNGYETAGGFLTRCTFRSSPTMRRSKIGQRWSLRAAFIGPGGGIGTWVRPWIGARGVGGALSE